MMRFEYYNPIDEKGSCVVRSISKVLNKDYFEVKNDLIKLSKELDKDDYRDTEVFEKYLFENGVKELNIKDILVKDLKLDKGKYLVFCYRDDWYHMLSIINNMVYDKSEDSLNLTVIKVYEVK